MLIAQNVNMQLHTAMTLSDLKPIAFGRRVAHLIVSHL